MRITGCIATEKVAKVIVPSENMTIPLTDPFLSFGYGPAGDKQEKKSHFATFWKRTMVQ